MAAAQILHDRIPLVGWSLGVDGRDLDIGCFQRPNLVFHQSKKRRDDNRDAVVDHGGELEAEGFAEGGGGLHEDIVAVEGGGDDFALVGSVE